MEGIYLVKTEVNEDPGVGEVGGGLQLSLVDGAVQITGIPGNA
jgi:hypothetical protein